MPTKIALALAAALAVFAFAPTAQAATAINGRCKLHIGALVRRNSAGSIYKARIGPKNGHVGGSHRCHGMVRVRRAGASKFSWVPFNLPNWRYHLIVSTTAGAAITASACAGFGAAILTELPTGGLSTFIAAGSAGGCATGVVALGDLLPGTDNGPVRLLK